MDAVQAIDKYLADLVAIEGAGAEIRFSEIYETYCLVRKARPADGWPHVSTVAMSRRLKALGGKRFQKRFSSTDKPIFYVLPAMEGAMLNAA